MGHFYNAHVPVRQMEKCNPMMNNDVLRSVRYMLVLTTPKWSRLSNWLISVAVSAMNAYVIQKAEPGAKVPGRSDSATSSNGLVFLQARVKDDKFPSTELMSCQSPITWC